MTVTEGCFLALGTFILYSIVRGNMDGAARACRKRHEDLMQCQRECWDYRREIDANKVEITHLRQEIEWLLNGDDDGEEDGDGDDDDGPSSGDVCHKVEFRPEHN